MQNNKSFIEPAFKNYFKTLIKSLPFLGLFTLVVLALWLFEFVMTMYGYSLGFFGIIIIGLIIVPLFFAAQVSTYMISHDAKDIPSQHFFGLFKLYFQPNFMGIYRIIRTILLSMVWAMGAAFVFSIAYYSFAQYFDPEFLSAMNTFMSYSESNDSEAAVNFLMSSEAFIRFVNINTYVSSAAEAIAFLVYMARNSAVMYVGEVVMAPSPKFVVDAYKNAFRGRHADGYNKDFFKGTWFIFLVFLVLYITGSVVGYFVFKDNSLQWLLMADLGLGFSLVLLPFVLPYFFPFLANLIEGYKKSFLASTLEIIKYSYEEMKSRGLFPNEEEEEKYKAAMKSYEDEANKETDENSDAENKENEDGINTDDYGSSDHH